MTASVNAREVEPPRLRRVSAPVDPAQGRQWDSLALRYEHPWLGPPLTGGGAPPSRSYLIAKRALDLAVSATVLLVAAPVLLLLMLAVKVEEPGVGVFFSQQRTGLGGRSFRMFKLRSMRPATSADLWPHPRLPHGPKTFTSPRVTPLGRFLRRTSLDELPQLFNVLRGDMALVGPRPTSLPPEAHDLWQTERLEVKPGLTGLWQIVARGAVSFPNRCRLDIAYARRPTLLFDLKILARSVPAVLSGRGAR